MPQHRVYLLSPAYCSGKRAALLLRDPPSFELARRLRDGPGVPLGELFAFISGLYFRGKLAYARAFAAPPAALAGVLIIVPGRGLVPADTLVTLVELRRIAEIPVDAADARYREPLKRDLRGVRGRLDARAQVVLLGSVATDKYVELLRQELADLALFPLEFVGRGDMSRGGLLLRQVRTGRPLTYVPLAGTPRHGKRPARLE